MRTLTEIARLPAPPDPFPTYLPSTSVSRSLRTMAQLHSDWTVLTRRVLRLESIDVALAAPEVEALSLCLDLAEFAGDAAVLAESFLIEARKWERKTARLHRERGEDASPTVGAGSRSSSDAFYYPDLAPWQTRLARQMLWRQRDVLRYHLSRRLFRYEPIDNSPRPLPAGWHLVAEDWFAAAIQCRIYNSDARADWKTARQATVAWRQSEAARIRAETDADISLLASVYRIEDNEAVRIGRALQQSPAHLSLLLETASEIEACLPGCPRRLEASVGDDLQFGIAVQASGNAEERLAQIQYVGTRWGLAWKSAQIYVYPEWPQPNNVKEDTL